jgi:hypothetical protein
MSLDLLGKAAVECFVRVQQSQQAKWVMMPASLARQKQKQGTPAAAF